MKKPIFQAKQIDTGQVLKSTDIQWTVDTLHLRQGFLWFECDPETLELIGYRDHVADRACSRCVYVVVYPATMTYICGKGIRQRLNSKEVDRSFYCSEFKKDKV